MNSNNNVPSVLLVNFLIDSRGDMYRYETLMDECLADLQIRLYSSEYADQMLISRTLFNNNVKTEDYVRPGYMDTSYSAQGGSKIYDAIYKTHTYTLKYAKRLKNAGKYVQPLMFILSGGYDTGSENMQIDARYAIRRMSLENVKVRFIAFGAQAAEIPGQIGISKRDVMWYKKGKLQLKGAFTDAFKQMITEAQRMGPRVVEGKDFIMLD